MNNFYLTLLVLAHCGAFIALGKEICYDTLGCFTNEYPFGGTLQRPFAFLPEAPAKMGIKFLLYTRESSQDGERMNVTSIKFNPRLPTKILVHGFLTFGRKKWLMEIKDALLQVSDLNVISIDWSKGNGLPYAQAVANSQLVGRQLGYFISDLVSERGVRTQDVHIIGHGLGAHVAGYAGQIIKPGRITALDPSGIYFDNTELIVRLDSSDADFVDVIHTDGSSPLFLGLGSMQSMGHVDYYPNGGKNQPGCPGTARKITTAIFDIVTIDANRFEQRFACSHMASVYLFLDSIRKESNCKYHAYPCSSHSEFESNKCLKCGQNGCNRMGYWSSESTDNGSLYLSTSSLRNTESFCINKYQIQLKSASQNPTQTRGTFRVYFETQSGIKSESILFDDSDSTFKPDSVQSRVVSSKSQLMSDDLQFAYLTFNKVKNLPIGWIYDSYWSFESLSLEDQHVVKFCPTKQEIRSGETLKFFIC